MVFRDFCLFSCSVSQDSGSQKTRKILRWQQGKKTIGYENKMEIYEILPFLENKPQTLYLKEKKQSYFLFVTKRHCRICFLRISWINIGIITCACIQSLVCVCAFFFFFDKFSVFPLSVLIRISKNGEKYSTTTILPQQKTKIY